MTIPDSIKLNNSVDAPEFLADGVAGTLLHNNILRLTFEVLRAKHQTHPAPLSRVVVARVAMPAVQAEQMARMILDALEKSRLLSDTSTQTSQTH